MTRMDTAARCGAWDEPAGALSHRQPLAGRHLHWAIADALVLLTLLVLLVSPAPLAPLSPSTAFAAGEDDSAQIAELTDRYASINDLSNSRNSDEAVIADTTVGVLTAVNRALNEMTVRFSGEAVGDVLEAEGGNKWVNLLGANGTSIGVLMSADDAALVENLGDYHTTGTTLEVEGRYSISCSDHEGALDVHADSVRVVDRGGRVAHLPDRTLFFGALGLCAAGFLLFVLFMALRRRSGRKSR